jgi:hypothetical protein
MEEHDALHFLNEVMMRIMVMVMAMMMMMMMMMMRWC